MINTRYKKYIVLIYIAFGLLIRFKRARQNWRICFKFTGWYGCLSGCHGIPWATDDNPKNVIDDREQACSDSIDKGLCYEYYNSKAQRYKIKHALNCPKDK